MATVFSCFIWWNLCWKYFESRSWMNKVNNKWQIISKRFVRKFLKFRKFAFYTTILKSIWWKNVAECRSLDDCNLILRNAQTFGKVSDRLRKKRSITGQYEMILCPETSFTFSQVQSPSSPSPCANFSHCHVYDHHG